MRQDLRYALRAFAKSPGFALTAVLVLALGIGANTAIFGVVNAVLIRPLPYSHPERLISISETRKGGPSMNVAGPNFRDWRDRATDFQGFAAYQNGLDDVSGGIEPERVGAAMVSRGFFRTMGARPILGRTFSTDEERTGGSQAAVIGESFWRRAFHASPSVLGRPITLEGKKWTIVGVVPESFDFPRMCEVWIPGELEPDPTARSAHNYRVVGRLGEGVGFAQARAQMTAIMERLDKRYPDSNKDLRARLVPLQRQATATIRPTLYLLFGAVGFVLLIACVNVANLLLARTAARRTEISIRVALGAGVGRLLRQLLTESLVLSLAGGAAGLLLAVWTNDLLISLIPAPSFPVNGIPLDGRVLAFALAASVLTGLLFGLAPAWVAARLDVNEGLKNGTRSSSARGNNRLRGALVAAEMALSFVLLAGAGLTVKSLLLLQNVDPGFDPKNVVAAEMSLPSPRGYQTLLDNIKSIPGVVAAGITNTVPLTDQGANGGFEVEGGLATGNKESDYIDYTLVSEDYFRTMGMRLERGRFIETADRSQPNVAMLNEAAARRFWPHGDAIGQRIRFYGFERKPQWLTIVGILGDIRHESLGEAPSMAAYVPFYQNPEGNGGYSLMVKTAPGANAAPAVRHAIRALDSQTPIRVTSMERVASASVATPRLRALFISLFAGFALALAAIGLYGVIANTVALRAKEIGIRLALGAEPREVVAMLLAKALALAGVGLGIGLAASLVLGRLIRSFLFEVSPTDPGVFAALALTLAAVALLASFLPAWRASRLDPAIALREE